MLFCDACPLSMGYWCPSLSHSFHCCVNTCHSDGIFYLEALAVLSVLHWVLHDQDLPHGACITLYSDNFNTIDNFDNFNTLHAQPLYNPILIMTVDLLYSFNVQLRVFHILGEDNIITDALSHFQMDVVYQYAPMLCISLFQPPHLMLGVAPL